jgi:hypothetical protein
MKLLKKTLTKKQKTKSATSNAPSKETFKVQSTKKSKSHKPLAVWVYQHAFIGVVTIQ